MFKRVQSHCSTMEAKAEERKYLFHVCRVNGYPLRFIKRHSMVSDPQNKQQGEEPPVRTIRVSLPYISNVSEATARLLAPHNIQVAHKPTQTLRAKVMRPKDQLPAAERSAIVYKIDCTGCRSNYVGETSKRLKTRLHEHRLAIRRGEQHSQIWAHVAEYNHRFDFENAQILANDATKGGRLLKEAWFSGTESINRRVDLCAAHQALKMWSASNRTNIWKGPNQKTCNQKKNAARPPPSPLNYIDGASIGSSSLPDIVGFEEPEGKRNVIKPYEDNENDDELPPEDAARHVMITRSRSSKGRHPPPALSTRSCTVKQRLQLREKSPVRSVNGELGRSENGACRQRTEQQGTDNGTMAKNILSMCEGEDVEMNGRPFRRTHRKEDGRKNSMGWGCEPTLQPQGTDKQDRSGLGICRDIESGLNNYLPPPPRENRMWDSGGIMNRGGEKIPVPNLTSLETVKGVRCEGMQVDNGKRIGVDMGGVLGTQLNQLGPMTRSRSRKQALNNCI